MPKNEGSKGQLNGRDSSGATQMEGPENAPPTLAEMGITYKQSSTAQKIADMLYNWPSRILRGSYATHATAYHLYLQLVLQGRHRGAHARADATVLPGLRRRGEAGYSCDPRQTLPRTSGRARYHALLAQAAPWPATEGLATTVELC